VRSQAEKATTKPLVVDFETRQEGENAAPRRFATWIGVSIDPARHVRPDHGPEDDRGQPDSREEPERERRRKCRRRDGG